MNCTTLASLCNRLALKQVRREILIHRALAWIPKFNRQLDTLREWERLIVEREPRLGEGSRKRLRRAG